MTIRPRGLALVVFGCFDGHKIVYDDEFVRDLKSDGIGAKLRPGISAD